MTRYTSGVSSDVNGTKKRKVLPAATPAEERFAAPASPTSQSKEDPEEGGAKTGGKRKRRRTRVEQSGAPLPRPPKQQAPVDLSKLSLSDLQKRLKLVRLRAKKASTEEKKAAHELAIHEVVRAIRGAGRSAGKKQDETDRAAQKDRAAGTRNAGASKRRQGDASQAIDGGDANPWKKMEAGKSCLSELQGRHRQPLAYSHRFADARCFGAHLDRPASRCVRKERCSERKENGRQGVKAAVLCLSRAGTLGKRLSLSVERREQRPRWRSARGSS